MGRSRVRLVDEKELLNKNKTISTKMRIYLMTWLKNELLLGNKLAFKRGI